MLLFVLVPSVPSPFIHVTSHVMGRLRSLTDKHGLVLLLDGFNTSGAQFVQMHIHFFKCYIH